MKWRVIAVAVSLIPFLLLFSFTPVSPADVFSVGAVPFLLSVSAVMVRILLQAYRFRYFINHFIGPNYSTTLKTMNARIAGEFVTQTTPSFIGGEIVRIAWLIKNGVSAGRAAWVATAEIIADVFVGSILAFIAGTVAIISGGSFIGILVILVAIPTFAFWFAVVVFAFGIFWGILYDRQKTLLGVCISHSLVALWAFFILNYNAILAILP